MFSRKAAVEPTSVVVLVPPKISHNTEEFPDPHRQVKYLLLDAPKMPHTFTLCGDALKPTHLTRNLRNTLNLVAYYFVPRSKRGP